MELTKQQKSLLIFLECACVDGNGLLIGCRMNPQDFEIAEQWKADKFIQFGRIAANDISNQESYPKTHWVILSDEAWEIAHKLRLERGKRLENVTNVERIGLNS